MKIISYWDGEKYIKFTGELVHTGAGWTGNVEYNEKYLLEDGRYLLGTRHKDRGDLMTDIRIEDNP